MKSPAGKFNAAPPEPIPLREAMRMGWSLKPYFLPSIPAAAGVLAVALLQADLLLASTSLAQGLINSFISAETGEAPAIASVAVLTAPLVKLFSGGGPWALVAGTILLALLGEALGLVTNQWRFRIAQGFRRRLQAGVLRALLRATGVERGRHDTAVAQTMFSNDCGSLGMLLIFGLLGFCEQVVKLVIYATGLSRLAEGEGWILAAVLIPVAVVFKLVVMRLFLRWEQRANERSNRAMMDSQRASLGFFPLMNQLVYLRGEKTSAERLLEKAETSARDNQRYQIASNLHGSVANLLAILALPLAAMMMLQLSVSPGEVVQGQALFAAVIGAVGGLLSFPGQFVHYTPALKRITAALAIPEPGERPLELDELRKGARCVEVSDLEFAYNAEGAPDLRGLSFEVPEGSLVCIVGASGSGKSTLARLITGELQPSQGSIRIGGLDVTRLHLWWRRELVGYLPAEIGFLVGVPFEENLRLGRDELPELRLREAASACGLDETWRKYGDTPMPAPIQQLSTGEQRRTGVARLLLEDQPVWIIDEPLANLDPALMRGVATSIQKASEGRTVFVVTHDPEFFRSVFNIFLHQGKVEAIGTHEELLEACPLYFDIYGPDSPKEYAPRVSG